MTKLDPRVLERLARAGEGKDAVTAFQARLVVAADEAVARCIREDSLIENGFTKTANEIAKLLMGGTLTID